MKKIISIVSTLLLAVVMCLTTVVATPVTAEAASKLSATSVKVKVGERKTVKLKAKYLKNYYISNVEVSGGDINAISGGYASDKIELEGASAGTTKLVVTVVNALTGKSSNYNVKVTVKGKAKAKKLDFKVSDTDGNVKNIKNFFGQPMVINIWADWCGWCIKEMPDMYEAYKSYKDDVNFMFIGMNCNSYDSTQAAGAQEFLKQYAGGNLPTYMDVDNTVDQALNVTSYPRTYFVNKKGYVVYVHEGAYSSAEDIKSDIKMYLK